MEAPASTSRRPPPFHGLTARAPRPTRSRRAVRRTGRRCGATCLGWHAHATACVVGRAVCARRATVEHDQQIGVRREPFLSGELSGTAFSPTMSVSGRRSTSVAPKLASSTNAGASGQVDSAPLSTVRIATPRVSRPVVVVGARRPGCRAAPRSGRTPSRQGSLRRCARIWAVGGVCSPQPANAATANAAKMSDRARRFCMCMTASCSQSSTSDPASAVSACTSSRACPRPPHCHSRTRPSRCAGPSACPPTAQTDRRSTGRRRSTSQRPSA